MNAGAASTAALAGVYRRATRPMRETAGDVELRVVRGALPAGLEGTLVRNGPGRQEAHGVPYGHPFDGDGMLARFAFEARCVRYRSRWVRTREFCREGAAGRMLYRSFGTNLPGGLARNALRLRYKNAANTSVVYHGGKLLALWEGGLPHEIDPASLETLRRYDFDGALRSPFGRVDRWLTPELPFSAHPKVCPRTGELFNFGTAHGTRPRLLLYRVPAGGPMGPPEVIALPGLSFVHDFVLTERHRIFFHGAVCFELAGSLLGLSTPVESLRARRAPTVVRVVPRAGGPAVLLDASPCFVFHFVNGFERPDGTIVVDALRMDAFPDLRAFRTAPGGATYPAPFLTRYVLDLRTRTVTEEQLSRTPCELATIDPREVGRPYRYAFAVAGPEPREGVTRINPLFSRIVRFDLTGGPELVRDFGRALPGEPIVTYGPGGERFVLTVVYEGEADGSVLHVLSPDDLSTVCALALPAHVAPGLHGTWVPALPS